MLGSDMSGRNENTCRGCCTALTPVPRLRADYADVAEWFSSRAVVYNKTLCWVKRDQAKLASS